MPRNAPIQEKGEGTRMDLGMNLPEGCPVDGREDCGCACSPAPAKRDAKSNG